MKCLENTRLQQLLTSSCIMYNLFWNEKSVQKVHTVPETLLLLEVSWEYTTSTTSDFFLHYIQSVLEWKVGTKSSHCARTLLSISSFVHSFIFCPVNFLIVKKCIQYLTLNHTCPHCTPVVDLTLLFPQLILLYIQDSCYLYTIIRHKNCNCLRN